ncbi:MAG TPA: phage holin, LLH family, partial [Abditibacteriaceae bacterium]
MKASLEVLVPLALIALAIALVCFIRNYLRAATTEKQIATIVQLANTGIEYIENLDKQGALPNMSSERKSSYKLEEAALWMVQELERVGISLSEEQGRHWVNAEFQKRAERNPVVPPVPTPAYGEIVVDNSTEAAALETFRHLLPKLSRSIYLAGTQADLLILEINK